MAKPTPRLSESDVEQKLVWSLLTNPIHLAIPSVHVRTKETNTELFVGKGTSAKRFTPDYIIYAPAAVPLIVGEAKSPREDVGSALREARHYASALNAKFPASVNPVAYVFACNGEELAYSASDTEQATHCRVAELLPGNEAHAAFLEYFNWERLSDLGRKIASRLRSKHFFVASHFAGGGAIMQDRIPSNSFAQDLAPVIRKYFSSDDAAAEDEILRYGYVSSDQLTKYERIFEDFLRTRTTPTSDRGGVSLTPTRSDEPNLTRAIRDFGADKPESGSIQLLIGGRGTGKSTFLKRYHRFLLPSDLSTRVRWARINFNEAPTDLSNLETWVCEKFIEAIRSDLNRDGTFDLRKCFGVELRDLNEIYSDIRLRDPHEYDRVIASQLSDLVRDKRVYAKAVARHLAGDRGDTLVVVFDNVDKRDRDQQLKIFELAQWFRAETRALIILALRNETYERHKHEPPLDAFLNSVHFYIAAPRFVNVVKKRLDLAVAHLRKNVSETLKYDVPGLGPVEYPATRLGEFIRALYLDLFQPKKPVAQVLEALSGRNVRYSLEMFTRIMQSGHLDERVLTSTFLGSGNYSIAEHTALRVLMRTDYRFFEDGHGFVTNIFDFEAPQFAPNFVRSEIVFRLMDRRKVQGAHGLEGFVYVVDLLTELEEIGFERYATLREVNYLLRQGLVESEELSGEPVAEHEAVKLHASGWVHFSILASRVEYLTSCALVTQVTDADFAQRVGLTWAGARQKGHLAMNKAMHIASGFRDLLTAEYERACGHPEFDTKAIGSRIVLEKVSNAIKLEQRRHQRRRSKKPAP